jgi:hypothetical protein
LLRLALREFGPLHGAQGGDKHPAPEPVKGSA